MTTKRLPRKNGRKKKNSERLPGAGFRTVFLGLGANLGSPRKQLEAAVEEIARLAPVERASSVYRSDPVGYTEQPDFWNMAVAIVWSGSPESLLAALKSIEKRLGRSYRFVNGPREIDIDILDFGGAIREKPDPALPHPRLASRRFALTPLAEIAPEWRDPVTGKSARQLLDELPRKPGVRKARTLRRLGRTRFSREPSET